MSTYLFAAAIGILFCYLPLRLTWKTISISRRFDRAVKDADTALLMLRLAKTDEEREVRASIVTERLETMAAIANE